MPGNGPLMIWNSYRERRAERIRELERDVAVPIADLIEQAERAVLAEAQPEGRGFTAREQALWDRLMAELEQLDARIAALVKLGASSGPAILALRDKRNTVWQEAKALIEVCTGA